MLAQYLSYEFIALFMFITMLAMMFTGQRVFGAIGFVAVISALLVWGNGAIEMPYTATWKLFKWYPMLTLPLFIYMGFMISESGIASDLYKMFHVFFGGIKGGLAIGTMFMMVGISAMNGLSVAGMAIGATIALPEMLKRNYDKRMITGVVQAGSSLGILIPPSITMIIYGISTGTSIGKLFIAGILPGIMLTALFMGWAYIYVRINREGSEKVEVQEYTWKERFEILPKILPFCLLVVGVLYVLYGGIATPNEASAVGALISIILVAVVYKMYKVKDIWAILTEGMQESVMLMMIIAASFLFSFVLSNLYVTQTLANEMVAMASNKWLLMLYINIFLLIAGCFLPPVAIILMTAPILYPIITAAGFDPIWFGVIMTINMEIGLITPPVGLNLFVIQGIAPDISIGKILKGSFPFVLLMMLQIILLCIFPEIATWLPEAVMK